MNLKPNVQDLREEVVRVLAEVYSLMSRASQTFRADESGDLYAQFREEVAEESHKVKHLELKMAIVAPMKAGKSTIINAIVGQDLLPSRNAAMTTLPTEIIFDASATEPVLVVPSETLSVFEQSFYSIQSTIEKQGITWIYEQLAEYPHLHRLVQKIQKVGRFTTQPETQGHQEIIETLLDLNDLVRLSTLVESKNLLNQLIDIPRIKTAFWQAQVSEGSDQLGNLVIIDTPGPNEAASSLDQGGDGFQLATVVKQQLSKCSIVLIVLDFTQLKTEAAERVKRDVQKVIQLRGKEHLYVLINKIDQRLEGDMTSKEVEKFVAAQFGIGDDQTKRVFEVSARQAFSAANLVQELNQNPGIEAGMLKTAETLARLVYGRRWQKELSRAIQNNDTEELQDEARLLWEDSGFDNFLKQAVNALMERAAPTCIKSALNLCQEQLKQLQGYAHTRCQGMAKEAGELQRQVDEINADLERLNVCYTKINNGNRTKADLHQKLSKLLARLQENAQVSLELYWDQQEYQRADFIGKRGIEAKNFVNWFGEKFGIKVEKNRSVIEFQTESKAEEFSSQAIHFATQRMSGLIEQTRDKAEQQIKATCQELINQLIAETKPIIERARQRLNESFDFDFTPPSFSLTTDHPKISRPRIQGNHRYVDQGYETRTVKKRSWWHWLWIVPHDETVKVKRPDKREDYYAVSMQELIEKVNHSMTAKIGTLAQGVDQYIDQDFQDRVNVFFQNLDDYLSRYKQSLQQAQADKKLSQDEKEQLVTDLTDFISSADSQIQETKYYIQCVDHLLKESP